MEVGRKAAPEAVFVPKIAPKTTQTEPFCNGNAPFAGIQELLERKPHVYCSGAEAEYAAMSASANTAFPNQGSICGASAPRRLLLAMLLLGFAVVFWGLHDKVSLYKHTGAAPPVAKAKLLSGREHAADHSAAASAPELSTLSVPLVVLFSAAMLRLLLAYRRGRAGAAPIRPPAEAPPFAEALHRRPPPVLAFAHA